MAKNSLGEHGAPPSKKKSGGFFSAKKTPDRSAHAAPSRGKSQQVRTTAPRQREEYAKNRKPVMRQTPSQRQSSVYSPRQVEQPPRAVLGTKETPRKSFTQEFVPTDVIDYVPPTNTAKHKYYTQQAQEQAQSTNSSGRSGKNMRKKKKSNTVYNVLIAVCILVFLVSAGVLIFQFMDYNEAKKVRNELEQMVVKPTVTADSGVKPLVDYSKLVAQNPDFVGWLEVANTPINYPVVKATDNDKYLYNNFYGEHHKLGTVFADYRNTLTTEKSSDNIVLYGHSAADGSYFAAIRGYKELDYFKAHPIISFNTTYESADWVIVGAFMADALDSSEQSFLYHNFIDFASEAEYTTFTTELAARSYFTSPADTQFGDKFITLSTCDYDFEEARFAVVARKLRPGETAKSFDFEATLENKNKIMPDRWYA